MGVLQRYDRAKDYFNNDDMLKIIDYNGSVAWSKVKQYEPIATIPLRFVDPNEGVTLAAGATATSEDGSGFQELKFTMPPAESRLVQVRPMLKMINQNVVDHRDELPSGLVYTYGKGIPVNLKVYWEHPAGVARGGTDKSQRININNIPVQQIGGVGRGSWNPVQIPFQSDPNEQFDLFTFKDAIPRIKIVNDSPVELGAESTDKGDYYDYDYAYELVFTGRKYELVEATKEDVQKCLSGEIQYGRVTVGGIIIVTTKADA